MQLKKEIIEYAKDIGIDLIGFTTAEPCHELRPILEERKSKGHLSGFEEDNIELRINPKATMESAKTIIVIGQAYFIDDKKLEKDTQEIYGEMARTAWGRDYHVVLKEKLNVLAEFIKSKAFYLECKVFVDTGPLVDRYLAYRAGLGWFGYNNSLINQEYGSWFFIGYMLINIEIEADEPLPNKCKGCRRCIEACPGKALEDGQGFNAKKCVSYLLQTKEELTEVERKSMGNRLYGCDVCQILCPHNKDVKKSTSEDFVPIELPNRVNLEQLLKMSNKEFQQLFSLNASGWRGKKVLQRNAIIALGNLGDVRAIPILIPLLKDPREDIREYVKWALNKLGVQV